MSRRPRAVRDLRYRPEPIACVCQPGPHAHPAHGRPGARVAKHFDPSCPHSELAHTTKPRAGRAKRALTFRIDRA